MKKILFVANPHAGQMGRFSGYPVLEFLRRARLDLKDWEVCEILVDDAQQINSEIKNIASDSIRAVFVLGGDGTVNHLLDTLIDLSNQGIPVGILPGGTANDFASELGMELSLNCIRNTLEKGQLQALDVIRVNGQPMITVGGIGMGSRLLEHFEHAREGEGQPWLGILHALSKSEVYTLLAIKEVLWNTFDPTDERSASHRLRIMSSMDGGHSETRTFTTSVMFICNQRKLGHSLTVCKQSSPSDGVFEVLALQPRGRLALLKALVDLKEKRIPSKSFTWRARSMVIEDLDGKPITVFGDGEILLASSRLEFSIQPSCLRVYRLKPESHPATVRQRRFIPLPGGREQVQGAPAANELY